MLTGGGVNVQRFAMAEVIAVFLAPLLILGRKRLFGQPTDAFTVVCGGEDFTDMENFGQERESWLRSFLELPNGIPDADTFRRVFERVDPRELSEVLWDWLGN